MSLRGLTICGGVLAVAVLGGCSHAPSTAPLAGAAPAPARLAYSDDGANAKLAYGVAAAQDAGFMLECVHGAGAVHLTQVGVARPASRLAVASGTARADVPAQAQDFEGRALLVGEMRTDAPPLAAFRRSGRLEVGSGAVRYGVSARGEERRGVERFFKACAAA